LAGGSIFVVFVFVAVVMAHYPRMMALTVSVKRGTENDQRRTTRGILCCDLASLCPFLFPFLFPSSAARKQRDRISDCLAPRDDLQKVIRVEWSNLSRPPIDENRSNLAPIKFALQFLPFWNPLACARPAHLLKLKTAALDGIAATSFF